MTVYSGTKINHLLQSWPTGTVGLSAWLDRMDVSSNLMQSYQQNGWFESIGHGAYQRTGDTVDWLGALYAVQKQAGLHIHIGARTALGLLGQAHYLELDARVAQLFASRNVKLPVWFQKHDWGITPELQNTDFLPSAVGLVDVESKLFSVKASGAARALMECLYLTPDKFEHVEAYQIMEGMGTLRPSTVQQLLEACRSIKVKRLFLFMAEQAGHAWMKHLDLSTIDLGQGKRSLAKGGVYIPKYQITVPRELLNS